ncbi:MAG: hypothetical protein R3250_04985 [Melioribacteraceae bacterium]|nr:hypothetical protein [Melioribacteraceae bacterium]
MNKKDFTKIADNNNYIPGIYNYCDSWCERCPFTGRCLNFEIGDNQMNDPDMRDFNNQKFWDKLSETLDSAIEMIEDEAKELGIDLKNYDDTYGGLYKVRERIVEDNSNLQFADKYINLVNEWFKNSENDFKLKQDQLLIEGDIDVKEASPYDDALNITDAIEIIRWYQYQIFVKIKRALFSATDVEVTLEDGQKPCDGSAKVALIGIDRSISAWGKLYNYFDESQDDILDILLHLSRMREILESLFPNARDFKRIGFDY